MLTLKEIQQQHSLWQKHNFPNRTWEDCFLGIVEETGELAHGLLKQKQGIRGTFEEHEKTNKDSIGDILIYTIDLCNARGYCLQTILEETWAHVSKRDWIANPNGPKS